MVSYLCRYHSSLSSHLPWAYLPRLALSHNPFCLPGVPPSVSCLSHRSSDLLLTGTTSWQTWDILSTLANMLRLKNCIATSSETERKPRTNLVSLHNQTVRRAETEEKHPWFGRERKSISEPRQARAHSRFSSKGKDVRFGHYSEVLAQNNKQWRIRKTCGSLRKRKNLSDLETSLLETCKSSVE